MESQKIPLHSQQRFLQQEQLQKREAFDKFINNFAQYSLQGFAAGLLMGLVFKRKMLCAGMGTGIGGGVALNQCASDFNKIEIRENRIARDAQEHEGRDRFIAKLNDIRLHYLRK